MSLSFDRETGWLRDIVDNATAALNYVEGISFEQFSADRKTIDAVERCVHRLTEAVIRIGPERMKEIAPDVPAHAVKALGNILRHEYDRVDLGTIYNTVNEDLPILREACRTRLTNKK